MMGRNMGFHWGKKKKKNYLGIILNSQPYLIIFQKKFFAKTKHTVTPQKNRLSETVLMRGHNMGFH